MGQNSTKHINDTMNEQVAAQTKPAAIEEAERLLEINRNQIFIEDDALIGNPYSILGKVIEIRKHNGVCPEDYTKVDVQPRYSIFPIPGVKIDEKSKIKQAQKVKSFIVDQSISAKAGVLDFLSAELDQSSAYSVIVNNQATGLIDMHDPSWITGVERWHAMNKSLLTDPNICYLLVVIGMVQKNIIRKKYKKFDVKTKGGAYGININGQLYTSTEDYSLDTRFGLSVAVLHRNNDDVEELEMVTMEENVQTLVANPNLDLMNQLKTISHIDSSL
ncbi:MAG: hypothetical protein AAF806_13955 [Bacteroidota bacterium]